MSLSVPFYIFQTFHFTQEEKEVLDAILAKRSKKGKKTEEKPAEEKTTLHSKI